MSILSPFSRRAAIAALAAVFALGSQAAFEVTIPAPGGVGDVAALTNALTQFNALSSRTSGHIYLQPGVYNLSEVYMTGASHLTISAAQHGLFAGLGDGPEDTVLIGGGESGAHRVLAVGGGGNFGWFTVSNMTVTGGWTSGDGGGISGNGTTRYSHLIVSNNYAAGSNFGGGGGCMRGCAEYCRFADNRIGTGNRSGGALWTDGGGGQQENLLQGAWHCVFSNNVAPNQGGALRLQGKCVDCRFFGNTANYGGAIVMPSTEWNWYIEKFTNTTEVLNSTFIGNTLSAWGHGSAMYCTDTSRLAFVSNCTFSANNADVGGNGVVYRADLYDCAIERNLRSETIFYDCNLTGCLVADNTNTYRSLAIDTSSSLGAHTNVNCLFRGNISTAYGQVSYQKAIVNCTYTGNNSTGGANYGGICTKCLMWNTVLFDNWIGWYREDVRAHNTNGDLPVVMTNCLFQTCDQYTLLDDNGYVTNDCVAATRKVSNMLLENPANGDYTPTTRSAAYNAGCQEPWILALLGEKDLAGNPRVYGGALDIGAYECQKDRPGLWLKVK